ncbi:MAG: sirohydrochlorin nickelochelatase [Candidatus Bathyarchaeota archaeon]|nr:sirohydrochlorin nickelochelatase [Candidatus Bathyarchaeota archaeon]
MEDNVGLVIIGHGSKLPHNRENLEKLADILRQRSQFKTVEIAFMVRNTPTIPEAIEVIAKRGVKKIVLVPAFLAAGVHTTQEIPELIGMKDKELQLTAKGVQLIYGEPLGSDERIADIIAEKAFKAMGKDVYAPVWSTTSEIPVAANEIYKKSLQLIRPAIKETLEGMPESHISIIERVVHTTADPEFAKLLFISPTAVEAGVNAIKAGAKVFTDVKMVKAGINEARVKKFGGEIINYVDDKRAFKFAHDKSTTRSIAAMRLAVEAGLDGSIVLIGNAPTAAFELVNAVKQGLAKPALIIATPVGYVGASESKQAISELPIPFIIVKGRKGGSTIAVAIFNALLNLAEESFQTKGD